MEIIELIKQPWYIAGPLVGLTVPALLILGNKILVLAPIYVIVPLVYLQTFSSLIRLEKEIWNMFFYSWDSNRRCNCFSFLSNRTHNHQ
jgi:hypothetical protein